MTIFNNISKDRDILYDGGVPLHKIVYSMYDFFYQYIHQCPINTIYYISALLKPETDCRPEVRTLAKLNGKAKMAQRVQEANQSLKLLSNNSIQYFTHSSQKQIPIILKNHIDLILIKKNLLMLFKNLIPRWLNNFNP